METAQVPVDVLPATLPIVASLVFLVPLRWRAPRAAPMEAIRVDRDRGFHEGGADPRGEGAALGY
ncbi:MAG TPA: hypothetical protein VH969_25900 [Actinophytocola sp.]|jgi:hypothetical protein|uniref:hypothetical protein n=1 Tax=Actinophytocola sp. TaxID=1872138 RepID=UPI002F92CE5D